MISGKLPNNTIWWLSTDGQKVWIESEDIEQDKFKEKGYNVKGDIIYHAGQVIGELTGSRLNSRKRKDAWIIKVASVTDIYPELIEEIKKKDLEDKKKRKESASKNKKSVTQKNFARSTNVISEGVKKDQLVDKISKNDGEDNKEYIVNKESKKDCFDVNSPYVSWLKEEVEKSIDGKVMLSFPTLKEKMGGDFLNMHDLRIFFGLKKILSDIGIVAEQGRTKKEHVVILKKVL